MEVSRNYDLLPAPFRVGPNIDPAGGYAWNTLPATYSSDDSRRIYGGGGVDLGGYYSGDKQTLRANLNFLPQGNAARREQLHAQPDHPAGRAHLRHQHARTRGSATRSRRRSS